MNQINLGVFDMRKFLSLLLVLFMTIFLFDLADAAATYNVSVTNNLSSAITVSEGGNNKCIGKTTDLPLTVPAYQTETFTYTDDNSGSCYQTGKYFYLSMKSASTAANNLGMNVKIDHGYLIFNQPDYTTWISQLENTGGMVLNAATCNGGNNCLNNWYNSSGNFNISLSVNYAQSYTINQVKAIGLGTVSITNGYGQSSINGNLSGTNGTNAVDLNSINNNNQYYIIHFSRANQTCSFNEGLLSCGSGITYYYDNVDNNYIFMCQQTSPGSSQCPWVKKSSTSSTYSPNIYG